MLDSNEYKSDSTLAQHCREADKVIGDYTKAIELNPDEASAYVKRGLAYRVKCKYDRAVADFGRAIELGNDSAYLERGSVYREKGEYDKAIVDYTKEIELCHQDPIAFYERGNAYKALGKKFEAIADFEEFIKLAKESGIVEHAKQEVERLRG